MGVYVLEEPTEFSHYHCKQIEYIVSPSGCWECVSHVPDGDGYPAVTRNKKRIRMLRYVYEMTNGTIPDGHMILHSCDNPRCINPAHLSAGTVQENNQQRDERGRQAKGEQNGNVKLGVHDVMAIRELSRTRAMTQKAIAAKFGVSKPLVEKICQGKLWKDLPL
jgi:predicted XRE-type DNA-binding protein